MFILLYMNKKNLNAVDLNLFKVLNAMHETRSVTKAAEALGLSQPAVSHALNRLRSLFGDEMFIRTPSGMRPTERCLSVTQPISDSMQCLIDTLQDPEEFDPAEATATVRITMGDLLTGLLPAIFMPAIARTAPNIEFRILPARGMIQEVAENSIHRDLDAGLTDLAFFWNYDVPSRFSWAKLGELDYICVGSRFNKEFDREISVDYYQNAPQVSTTAIDRSPTRFDREIGESGHRRSIKLCVPHYSASMHVVSSTDMIASIPRILAPVAREKYGLKVAELPIPSPVRAIIQIWHKTRETDPLHKWARELVAGCYAELENSIQSGERES